VRSAVLAAVLRQHTRLVARKRTLSLLSHPSTTTRYHQRYPRFSVPRRLALAVYTAPMPLRRTTATETHGHVAAPYSAAGHFGGSNYKGKPSAIITYSAGPWGGPPQPRRTRTSRIRPRACARCCVDRRLSLSTSWATMRSYRPGAIASLLASALTTPVLDIGELANSHAVADAKKSAETRQIRCPPRCPLFCVCCVWPVSAGMRAAMALRPLLSELGCLPISKLTGYPSVSAVRQQMC
jgi:hypothetical protein